MHHYWARFRTVLLLALVFCANLTDPLLSSVSATSCDPQWGTYRIGDEYVADACIPDGMNDDTAIHYTRRSVICSGGVVVEDPDSYSVSGSITPNNIIANKIAYNFRVLRNKEGSYILGVHRYYTGTIDGKSMALTGQIFDNIITSPIWIIPTTPDCAGRDFNPSCSSGACCLGSPEIPANSTVNMGTGRLSHSQTLFSVSGGQVPLSVSLSYRSIPFAPSTIGNGWSHSHEATLVSGSGNEMVFWNEGTRRVYGKYSSSGPYVPPRGDHSALVRNADNSWTLTELDGVVRTFDSSGRLTSIRDRYNNTLVFGYTSGKLATVTDATGRSVSFGYNATTGKLETVTEPLSANVHTLHYDSSGRLDSVTPPGNRGQWVYTYAANGLLETKKDPENNLSRYSYYGDNRLKDTTDPNQKVRGYVYPLPVGDNGKIPDAYPAQSLPQKAFNFTEKDGGGWSYTFDTLTSTL